MKKIALVLGSGGARGLSHIGVLKVLEREKVPIKTIVGTSIGALIGGFYAAGISPDSIEAIGLKIKTKEWLRFIDMTIPSRGLVKGVRIERFLYQTVGKKNIENLPVRFSAVVADIEKGVPLIIERGDLVKAIRASISIPGLFVPLKYKNKYLVDGGIINPVPVDIAKKDKPDKIIAVNVCTDVGMSRASGKIFEKKKRYNLYDVILRSFYMMENEIATAKLNIDPSHILIKPEIDNIHILEFQKIKKIIELGEQAAEKALSQIRKICG
jgi:NTE family protein